MRIIPCLLVLLFVYFQSFSLWVLLFEKDAEIVVVHTNAEEEVVDLYSELSCHHIKITGNEFGLLFISLHQLAQINYSNNPIFSCDTDVVIPPPELT